MTDEQKAVEQVATPRSDWFRVEVTDCDGQVVAIETEMLTGRADIGDNEQHVIEKAIRHLAGFLGRPAAESLVSAAPPEGMVLPCPFCGEPPSESEVQYGGHPAFIVRCCIAYTCQKSLNGARKTWNTRAARPVAAPLREQIIEECARVCEAQMYHGETLTGTIAGKINAANHALKDCAEAIRALSAAPNNAGDPQPVHSVIATSERPDRASSDRGTERDCLTLALRLYGENPDTLSPETREVMGRWRPKVEALLLGAPSASWLIESRDPQTRQTYDYVEDIDARYPRIVFTKDASKAARFPSKEDAQSMVDSCRTIQPAGLFEVEEHAFDCGMAPESALPPIQNAVAGEAESPDARDAKRYRWLKEHLGVGAPYNDKLLHGHRNKNRTLLSVILYDEAASKYACPVMGNLDAAVDAAMGSPTDDEQR